MTHVDDLLEELEAVVNEILVREDDYDKDSHYDDHMRDLMCFANISMGGLLACVQLGLLTEEQFNKAKTISTMYADNSSYYKGL